MCHKTCGTYIILTFNRLLKVLLSFRLKEIFSLSLAFLVVLDMYKCVVYSLYNKSNRFKRNIPYKTRAIFVFWFAYCFTY